MLRLTVSTEEYLMIGEDIKLVFLGGTGKHLRIMIDAPREKNIVRSTVLEKNITDPEERARLPRYYAEEEHPEKYVRKDGPGKRTGAGRAKSAGDVPGAGKAKLAGDVPGAGRMHPAGDRAGAEKVPEAARDASPEKGKPMALKKPGIIITRGNVKSGSR